jgi:DNA repair protein RadC
MSDQKDGAPGFAEAFGQSVFETPNVDPRQLANQVQTLAILLEYASHGKASRQDVEIRSNALMQEFGNLGSILNANVTRLQQEGLTQSDITLFRTVLGAQFHSLETQIQSNPIISSWDSLLDYLHGVCAYDETEQFRVLYLDKHNVLIKDEKHGQGTVDHVPVYPREVVKRALELNSSAIILVHNHPSGNSQPSESDIAMTTNISSACKTLGITLHDHIIIGKYSDPFSFKVNELIP